MSSRVNKSLMTTTTLRQTNTVVGKLPDCCINSYALVRETPLCKGCFAHCTIRLMFTPSEDDLHRRDARSTLLLQLEPAFSIACYATGRVTLTLLHKIANLSPTQFENLPASCIKFPPIHAFDLNGINSSDLDNMRGSSNRSGNMRSGQPVRPFGERKPASSPESGFRGNSTYASPPE